MQIQLNFDTVHRFENNTESQRFLNLKRADFNTQCWATLERMLQGERLTYLTAINSGIGDIRRRAKDLIDHAGIPVIREWAVVDGEQKDYKWYYISREDSEAIKKQLL